MSGAAGDMRAFGQPSAMLTCPRCGYAEWLVMPVDACLYFHECTACRTRLKPRPGDCCVFCSFGDRPCPPMAKARGAGD